MKRLIGLILACVLLFPVSGWATSTKISAETLKAAPVAADTTIIVDSADGANKKVTLGTIPAWTNIPVIGATGAPVHKGTPIDADYFILGNSASSNAWDYCTGTELKAFLKTYFDGLYPSTAGISGGQTLTGGTGVTNVLSLKGTSGNGTLTSPAIQALVGNNGGTVALTTLNNGNVGIGTTNPGYTLDVNGTINTSSDIAVGQGHEIYFKNYAAIHAQSSGVLALFNAVENNFTRLQFGGTTSSFPALAVNGSDLQVIRADGSANANLLITGNVGIGTTSPTARLHLPASTASENTASLKITPGVVATTPVTGNIESDGTHLYWTDSGGTRKQLDN